jgi:hypothetical protein
MGTSMSERDWKSNDAATPFFVRAADRLFAAVERQINETKRIDARSEIGDAALDYRQERDKMAERAERARNAVYCPVCHDGPFAVGPCMRCGDPIEAPSRGRSGGSR